MLPPNLVQWFLAAGPNATSLPHPGMPDAAQRVVRAALYHAWARVREGAGAGELRSATEPQITTALHLILNQLLDDESEPVPGFTSSQFEAVERGAESVNYSGRHLEKRPDLRFRLQGRIPNVLDRTHYGLFVECKILDRTHPLRRYATEGILRFIDGDYGWAMRHGMMLTYGRDEATRLEDIVTFLKNHPEQYGVADVGLVLLSSETAAIVRSIHRRSWQYLATPTSPGPIELVHVWLSLN